MNPQLRFFARRRGYTACMKLENALRWSWMNVLTFKRMQMLLEQYTNMDDALNAVTPELLVALGCRQDTVELTLNRLEEFDIGAYAGALRKKDIVFLSIDDDLYPASLRTLPDPPVFLYARGDLSVVEQPCVALVGSREMNDEGRRVVRHFVPPIVHAGCVTVSGLAYGVDAEVAQETLAAKGKTVAVLGNGLGSIYPVANAKLADSIVAGGGLVLSEFPMDMRPDKFTFPARNRIIAGLSLATVVVQAAEKSGSLITAELALEYGREVCAVPGSVFDPLFSGCHNIISSGQAKLVTDATQVLQEIGIVLSAKSTKRTSAFVADTPDEAVVFDILTTLPVVLDDLVVKAKLNAAVVSAVLTMLEIKGVARKTDGGKWVRA